jgi:hypothetical protein
MRPLRTNAWRRRASGFFSILLAVVAPKCVFCASAYFGIGLGALSGRELCGAPTDSGSLALWSFALGMIALIAWRVIANRFPTRLRTSPNESYRHEKSHGHRGH